MAVPSLPPDAHSDPSGETVTQLRYLPFAAAAAAAASETLAGRRQTARRRRAAAAAYAG